MSDEARDIHNDEVRYAIHFEVPIPEQMLAELSDEEIVDMVMPVVEKAIYSQLDKING